MVSNSQISLESSQALISGFSGTYVKAVGLISTHILNLIYLYLKEPFNDVPVEYSEKLTAELVTKLKERCVFKSPKSKVLLEQLFEFIIFRLHKTAASTGYESANPEMRYLNFEKLLCNEILFKCFIGGLFGS